MTEKDKEIQELRREVARLCKEQATDEHEKEIMLGAIYIFGPSHQMKKAIEEMAELTKELCKRLDGAGNDEQIADEMADVGIMLDQMELLFNNTSAVKQHRAAKLERLNKMLFDEQYG